MKHHSGYFVAPLFAILFCILFTPNKTFCQDSLNNVLHAQLASNIWGNTMLAGYDHYFSKHIYAGVSFGTGYFQYSLEDGTGVFVVSGIPRRNNIASFDFKQIIDLKLGYILKRQKGIHFFNKFEMGASYTHFDFKDQYVDMSNYLWKGEKSFSLYSLLLSISLIDYKPKLEKNLGFEFGVKSRFTMTKNETLTYENSFGGSYYTYLYHDNGNTKFIWIYPELFIKIDYSL